MREKAGFKVEGAAKTHLLAWLTFDTLGRQPHEAQGTGKRETGREKKRMRDRHGQQESMLMAQQPNKRNHCEIRNTATNNNNTNNQPSKPATFTARQVRFEEEHSASRAASWLTLAKPG